MKRKLQKEREISRKIFKAESLALWWKALKTMNCYQLATCRYQVLEQMEITSNDITQIDQVDIL